MGKQRIAQLLDQIDKNQQKDLKNSAAIYSVAQVAVNQLPTESTDYSDGFPLSLPSPPLLDKPQLLKRYGSYNGCRKAAKDLGLQFTRTPSWKELGQALGHAEILQQLTQSYLQAHQDSVFEGVTLKLRLDSKKGALQSSVNPG